MPRRFSPGQQHRAAAPANAGAPPPFPPAPGNRLSERVSSRGAVRTEQPPPPPGWGELEPAFQATVGSESFAGKVTPVLFESLDVATLVEITADGPGGGLTPQTVSANDERRRVITTEEPPWCWVCSLLITTGDGRLCLGSGWVVSPHTIITAGHCLHTRRGSWVRRVEVLVARNEGTRLSAHVSSDLHSVRGWTEEKDWEYDYGAVLLSDAVRPAGGFRYKVLSDQELQTLRYAHVAGYPYDRTPEGTLWGCGRALAGVYSQALVYQLSTYGGQSGGPVFYKVGADRFAVGIHAYGGRKELGVNYATRITPEVYTNIKAWIRMSGDPATRASPA